MPADADVAEGTAVVAAAGSGSEAWISGVVPGTEVGEFVWGCVGVIVFCGGVCRPAGVAVGLGVSAEVGEAVAVPVGGMVEAGLGVDVWLGTSPSVVAVMLDGPEWATFTPSASR